MNGRTQKSILIALVLALTAPLSAAATLGGTSLAAETLGLEERDYIVGFFEAIPRGIEVGDPFHGGIVKSIFPAALFLVVTTGNPVVFEMDVRQDERVRYIEWDDPAYAVVSFTPNDARYGDAGHWGSKKIGAEAAWDRTLGSTSVKVAVIDSGLRKTHEDFAGSGRVLQGYDWHNGDSDPNDDCGHGTHVTGTIGATINNAKGIAGMAQVTLIPLKGLGQSLFGCSGSTSGLANALRDARDQGAHFSSNSWGGGGSTSITDAINYAYEGGVVQIAAAGNSGPCTNCVSEPWKSNAARVVIVASTTSSDGQSSFSSEGPEIDVAAPGSDILSAWHSSDTAYNTISGTSMATPHVTGAAALVKTLNPSWGFADIDNRLKSTAVDLGASGKDDDFGYGRINADAATAGSGGGTNPACSDGTDNDGDGLIDYPDDPGCTSTSDDDEYNAPPPPDSETTVYAENFDDGSAQGWTKSSSGDLWHLEDGCVADNSPAYKLAWTRSGYCDYNTGSRVTNWAKSGAVSLSGTSQATLKFVHQFDIEQYSGGAYDILRVQVSTDGSTWTTLEQWDSTKSDVTSWTAKSYDLDTYTGGSLYLRFWTDTVDSYSNNHAGWFIDDIEVTAA